MPYRNKADRKKQVNNPVDSPEFKATYGAAES